MRPKLRLFAVDVPCLVLCAGLFACVDDDGGLPIGDRAEVAFILAGPGDSMDIVARVCAPAVESSRVWLWKASMR